MKKEGDEQQTEQGNVPKKKEEGQTKVERDAGGERTAEKKTHRQKPQVNNRGARKTLSPLYI